MTDTRIADIVAELRAQELVKALRAAVNGASHWRYEATKLLRLIDGGWLPERHEPPHHDTQDAA